MANLIKSSRGNEINNKNLFNRAKQVLAGGVNSPVRSFNYAGINPILIKEASGVKIKDYNGNSYIDYVISYGSIILGHKNLTVIKAINNALKYGLHFGVTNMREIELAELIKKASPSLEKIRFVNSGTEAVMGAIRLARGFTGRDSILKFKHSYHGHADYLLVESGSGLASMNLPLSKGVPNDFIKKTIVADIRDKNTVDKIFKHYGKDIAAVIIEPVGGNYGVIQPDKKFLKYLRAITRKNKSLLIFDEVITGFRFGFGILSEYFNIKADLVCLGKIIGGGLPIGAYGGKKSIMKHLAPEGDVYQASTFAGNPIVMEAGKTTINILKSYRKNYVILKKMTYDLCKGIKKSAQENKIDLNISYYGSMFSLKFKRKVQFQEFYKKLLHLGVFFAPSEYESNFVSFAHSQKDIDKTKNVIDYIFKKL